MKRNQIALEIHPKTIPLASVLEKFLIYLCGVDRGSKPLESAKQIVADVRRALIAIQAEELEALFDGDCLRDKYLMGYCVKKNHSALPP